MGHDVETPEGDAGTPGRGREGGRVGRPPVLTVDQVVDTAVELADREGLEGLSMPKLARHLGVGTMTLYGYVANKQDLLDRMAVRMFQGLDVPKEGPWQERLTGYFRSFRRSALAHPTLAGLLAAGRVTIPEVFDTLETVLGAMQAEGVGAEASLRTFYAGLTYTLGFVLWEIPRTRLQPEREYEEQWADLIARLGSDRHPLLTGPAARVAGTVASDEQFEWGLARVLRV